MICLRDKIKKMKGRETPSQLINSNFIGELKNTGSKLMQINTFSLDYKEE